MVLCFKDYFIFISENTVAFEGSLFKMIISRDWGKEKDASGGVMYRIYGFYI